VVEAAYAVEPVAATLENVAATLGFVYPEQMLVIPSPVAILKGTPNLVAAKKFVDFLLSKEGQALIAGSGTLPVRSDVAVPPKFGIPPTDEAVRRALKLDYEKTIAEKEELIQRFDAVMRSR